MPELQITETRSTGIEVVQSFFDALRAKQLDRALEHLSEDIIYENAPLPTDHGKAAVERKLRAFQRMATRESDIREHNIAERGSIVLSERTDIIRGRMLDLEFWVCGTFEVRDGKIVNWRDRYDFAAIMLQVLMSPLRTLLRARSRPKAD
jgi:limonene-1,2-epoxide hydrolase